ncbi:MAG: hypothetical protein JJE50_01445 [Actinomycetales bacterium]|nr:hypothetical protein [Actinomycetales bacterium]
MVEPSATVPPAGPPSEHPSLEDPGYRCAVLELLGLLAYGEVAAFNRLAKDAQHAPALADQLVLSRMAAGELSHVDGLEQYVASFGGDLTASMEPFRGVLGDFDDRTSPRDWWERLMKTYIGYGIVFDFQREVSGGLDPQTRAVVDGVLADNGHADYVVSVLIPAIAAEPQLGARLALWGRRVVGDALGVAQHALAEHPVLAQLVSRVRPEDDAAKLLNRLAGVHSARMERLGLNA